MAFCSNCGASVNGAFCPQCGTPAGPAASQAQPPQAPPPQPPQYQPPQAYPPPAYQPQVNQPTAPPPMSAPAGMAPGGFVSAPPVKRGLSPIVWILLIIGGLIFMGIVAVVGFTAYVVRNPGRALAKLVQASNPDVEVLDSDSNAQTMHLRDRKTGEEFTISFDDVKNGKIRVSGRGKDGHTGSVEFGAGTGKLPSWVPVYPGAKAEGNFTATGTGADGSGEGGMVTFKVSASASQVRDFYQAKFKELNMTQEFQGSTDAMSIATGVDPNTQRTLHIQVSSDGGETTVVVTYGVKE
jgi:hypothetical protein